MFFVGCRRIADGFFFGIVVRGVWFFVGSGGFCCFGGYLFVVRFILRRY